MTPRSACKLPSNLPTVELELDDRDLLNLISGGLTGIHAYTSGKLKVKGDLSLAQQLEQVFQKAGGVEKVMFFLKSKL